MDNIKRGRVRSFFDGAVHLLVFTNLYNGEGSPGDKIMDRTMYRLGVVDRPYAFMGGMFSGAALEIGIPLYAALTDQFAWKEVLLADLALKTVPRMLERLIGKINLRGIE